MNPISEAEKRNESVTKCREVTPQVNQSVFSRSNFLQQLLRRQKAEQCSRGAREILDRPLVVATERININFHSLTRAHIFELSFLEVRRHPDIVKGNDGKQTLSWLNPLAEFDGFASNDTADGRIDLRIAKIQFRDAYIRLRLIHLAHAGIRFGSGIA